jgi:RNA polymerase sigma-70 factor (ECF subfamily)
MNEVEITDVIKGCVSGKRKAQEQLFKFFSEEMFGVCLYYSKDYTEAEDTLHEGFIKVFLKIEQFQFKGSLAGWIRRIMVNTALEKYRKNVQMYAIGDDIEMENDIEPSNVLETLSAEELIKMIHDLTPKYRMVFNLYAVEGYSHKEISLMLGISEGTSKSNLARARNILQQKVKKYYYSSASVKDIK